MAIPLTQQEILDKERQEWYNHCIERSDYMGKRARTPKPMSLIEFNDEYGTEEQCREHLFEKRFGNGFHCPKCTHEKGVKISSRLLMQCSKCHYQVSVTSGTVMNDTKLPIRKWYMAIYLITSSKRGMSSLELQKQIKVTYKTAWYVNKRIKEAMKEAESKYKLTGSVSIDEAYFSGRKSGENVGDKPKKRGRGTNKSKVIVAVSLNKDKNPLFAKMRVVDNFKAKTIEKFAKDNVSVGVAIVTDGFKAYKGQSLKKDYFHEFENFDKTDDKSPLKWIHILISNAKAFINGTFHGLERNELQSYLDEFCYRFNRRFIPHLVFDKLIASVLVTKPVGYYAVTEG
jgi:transposase-like protein